MTVRLGFQKKEAHGEGPHVALSTFYNEPSASHDNTTVIEAITAIRDEFEAYGRRRIRAECAIEG